MISAPNLAPNSRATADFPTAVGPVITMIGGRSVSWSVNGDSTPHFPIPALNCHLWPRLMGQYCRGGGPNGPPPLQYCPSSLATAQSRGDPAASVSPWHPSGPSASGSLPG